MDIVSLFAGVGGIDLGFEESGFTSIWANEIDKYAAVTYKLNFPETTLVVDDIMNIKGDDIPKTDVLVAGFPCQAFSVAGYRKGFNDSRGNLFFEIARIIDEMKNQKKQPEAIMLENVKNLRTHDHGRTYKIILETLRLLGYHTTDRILNSSTHGNTPQNRERIYIVGFLNKKRLEKFQWPNEIKLTKTIWKVINRNQNVDMKYYYTEESSKYYNMLNENMINNDSIYQLRRVYVRENKSKLCPTLTANMGTGGHNVPLIRDSQLRIRKLTPKETFSIQGFPEKFKLPDEISNGRLYKQAGNSVPVKVVERIAISIKKVMEV